jgi:ubiquinol oxidase
VPGPAGEMDGLQGELLLSHMPHEHLVLEQTRTLSSPRRKYGFLARLLFFTLDLFYGRARTLSKFKVLEVIARVPYQAWEHVAYIAMTHKYGEPNFARRIFDFVSEARHQQDNEQWHLLILEEMVEKKNIKEGFLRYRLLPQVIAFFYYHVSWLLYVIRPGLSYALNADFEDHAEHEYMEFVRENPRLEGTPFQSVFENDYGRFDSQADLFRQIAVDERQHKEESLSRMAQPRFSLRRSA